MNYLGRILAFKTTQTLKPLILNPPLGGLVITP